ncbi:penicillin-binding transpeptidase domain-containing protein [Carnobacterium divergens]|uniref:penicillin-binding transpeptidase domain-containing protein n=1 Tax=Carnobacterium divergens TaxID=2748 RepID=UPI001EE389F7|nr:penicillin-binding transpeptidase domain-containing protein [Carnobacterium divergens]
MIINQKKKINKKKKNKSHIPFRLNLLFFVVFLLFASLILRLGYLQIVRGEEFETQVKRTETTTATGTVPRGMIYDSQNRQLVGNKPLQAITYTRGAQVSGADMAKIAKNLANYITMDTSELKERDLKDYFAATNEKKLNDRLSKKEAQLKGGELYDVQLSKITPEEIQFDEAERQVAAIFKKMNGAYALTTTYIKSKDVTDEEIAEISENLMNLPGVDTSTDWDRIYPQGDMLRSVLGSVTTEKIGLPSDQASAMLAKGYARNDRVGNSYLEKQYEEVLSGSKSKSETKTNNSGDIIDTATKYEGAKGDNLVLTIDIDFQKKLEEITKKQLASIRSGLVDRMYVVATNPKTGELLGMTGQKYNYETNEIEDDALGAMNTQYTMGSSVKGATVLAGYMDKVISLDNNVMVDRPLKFKNTPAKSSWFNRGGAISMNDETALEVSSNSYMMQLAMRMGGQNNYTPEGTLDIDKDKVFTKLRGYYAQFGLGVPTGIDLPGEALGYPGPTSNPGLALDFAFGQFDTYTPLQLNQYISTIANGGSRIAPHVVKEIRGTDENGNIGAIQTEIQPKILNTVNVGNEEMKRVQTGMYNVVHGGNLNGTGKLLASAPYSISAKTGTAEAFYDGPLEASKGASVFNLTLVGYAPSDDPEIAIAVVVPYLPYNTNSKVNINTAREVFDAYFEGKDK